MKIKNSSKYVNHFSSAAVDVNKRRSSFHRPCKHSTTFTTGKLIPIYVDEVLPGSRRVMNVGSVIRGATPLFPVMDNAYCDIVAFFVPNRLVYDEWEEFMGENKNDFWENKEDYLVPKITVTADNVNVLSMSALDYLGAIGQLASFENGSLNPLGELRKRHFNALFTRGICKCWNDWYRNQNLDEPCHIYTDGVDRDVDMSQLDKNDYVQNAEFGGALLPVNKFKDYFTSGLPAPQKHDPITIPIGSGVIPVQTMFGSDNNSADPAYLSRLKLFRSDGQALGTNADPRFYLTVNRSEADVRATPSSLGGAPVTTAYTSLGIDLNELQSVTVNQLRLAFQTQKFYETQARGGSRYTEILLSMFGCYSADSRLQRAEFLGGKRVPIHQYQVSQTAGGQGLLGDTGAFSLTSDKSFLFDKGFVEHGMLFVFAYVRTDQTYGQGQERMFARRSLTDYYFPVFAHLGEQAIKNKEIFYQGGDNEEDEQGFAYQEAWAEYRYKPNRVSGLLRPEVANSLSGWNYANKFENLPVLNADFGFETDKNVERTLAVADDTQWIADFYFDEVKEEVMPVYSVPGLVDHF